MRKYPPAALTRAVAAICPDIKSHAAINTRADERSLWWELSTCVLSSQVPYNLAVSAANAIDSNNYLLQERLNTETLRQQLFNLLSDPLSVNDRLRKYRFPESRSRQLSDARATITSEYGSLSNFLESTDDASEARSWLIGNVQGLGPKQASMFLRNVGVSYELAILDRHVLNYMSVLGIYSEQVPYISNIKQYKRHEAALQIHAKELDCSVGLLDWAIWIVMRVANGSSEVAA